MTALSARPAIGRPSPRTPDDQPADSAYVVRRLEDAGQALLAIPATGWSTRLRTSGIEFMRSAAEVCADDKSRIRPPPPDSKRVSEMDEAMAWIAFIPQDRYVLRRIVGARSLVSPTTDRHLFTWRRLAAVLGADHKAIQRWHAQGIDIIVAALNRPKDPPAPRRRTTGPRLPCPRNPAAPTRPQHH